MRCAMVLCALGLFRSSACFSWSDCNWRCSYHLELKLPSFSVLGWNILAFFVSGFESVLPPLDWVCWS
jgi:hypothetical protein